MLNQKHLLTRHLILLDSRGNRIKELRSLSKLTVYYKHSFKLCNYNQRIEAFNITSFSCEEEATEFVTSPLVISKCNDKYTISIFIQ